MSKDERHGPVILTVNIGVVNRPHAKNSKKMTIAAW